MGAHRVYATFANRAQPVPKRIFGESFEVRLLLREPMRDLEDDISIEEVVPFAADLDVRVLGIARRLRAVVALSAPPPSQAASAKTIAASQTVPM